MSRRAAEAVIAAGEVTVNGVCAEIGQKIRPDEDIVMYNGKRIEMPLTEKHVCIALYKPRGYLSSVTDDRGRKCVTELVSDAGIRLYPVGRLDMDSDGLLLMSNDGELTEILTHPKHEIPKIYHVRVKDVPTEKQLFLLRSRLTLDGYKIQPVKTEVIEEAENGSSSLLRMTLFEGRNRQIRKMCEIAEIRVLTLTRVSIGKITLGDLKKGEFRFLSDEEIAYLKSQDKTGEK